MLSFSRNVAAQQWKNISFSSTEWNVLVLVLQCHLCFAIILRKRVIKLRSNVELKMVGIQIGTYLSIYLPTHLSIYLLTYLRTEKKIADPIKWGVEFCPVSLIICGVEMKITDHLSTVCHNILTYISWQKGRYTYYIAIGFWVVQPSGRYTGKEREGG